jgi:hypothetical protein
MADNHLHAGTLANPLMTDRVWYPEQVR